MKTPRIIQDMIDEARDLLARAEQQKEKGSWIVTMRCVVIKDIVTSDCTKEEAETDPFEYADDENEIEQIDWKVLKVKRNI